MDRILASLALCLAIFAIPGAAAHAAETRRTIPGAAQPAARIADLAWLEGSWRGDGITGPAEEVYSAPSGGQIVGHFRQLNADGTVWFYEIMAIAPMGDSLVYRLKHFNADLSGWEEKAEVRAFPLIAVEKDAWYFDGLTIRRDGPDGMVGAVRIDNKDGTSREVVLRYRRARP